MERADYAGRDVGVNCNVLDLNMATTSSSSSNGLNVLVTVMISPRGQSGLEAKILASATASKLWPRPRGFGLGLASMSYYVIGHFSCKNGVKFGNFVNFSSNNVKSYVVNHYLVLFHNYFWPRPRSHSPCLGLGLGLEVLASFNITG